MTRRPLTVGVVGATGVAGAEIVRQLTERAFPCRELRLFGTTRTAGAVVEEGDVATKVELLGPASGDGMDLVFFAAGSAVARERAPEMAAAGALVVDVSSAFRADPAVPLVVPEVNAAAAGHGGRRIVALPSPTAMVLATVLAPLAAVRPVRRVVASTYQGAGTAGTRTLRALARETIAVLGGRGTSGARAPLAFDCHPLIGPLDADGTSSHERSVARELVRVLGAGAPPVFLTAVRVPVFTGLGVSLVVDLESPVTVTEVVASLRQAPGLLVHGEDDVPTLRSVAGSPAVHVGRIRRDPGRPATLALWAAVDGVVKGRGGAAVTVAEIAARDGGS